AGETVRSYFSPVLALASAAPVRSITEHSFLAGNDSVAKSCFRNLRVRLPMTSCSRNSLGSRGASFIFLATATLTEQGRRRDDELHTTCTARSGLHDFSGDGDSGASPVLWRLAERPRVAKLLEGCRHRRWSQPGVAWSHQPRARGAFC